MPGFGLAGAAGFAQGFGGAFNQSLHQSQELQLERQRLQMQQDRERLARADSDRDQLFKTIQSHAADMLQRGVAPADAMAALAGPIQALERLTKASGHDPATVTAGLGAIFAQAPAADIPFGPSGGGQQPQPRPQRDTAFDQAPQQFTPGMQQGPSPGDAGTVPFMSGPVGGAGQPSAAGPTDMGAAPQPATPQPAAPEVNSVLREQFQTTVRRMRAEKDPEVKKLLAKQADHLLSQSFGANVKTFHDDGGFHVYNPATDQEHYVPYKEAEGQSTAQPEPSAYGLSTLSPKQLKELDKANVGPKQFDFEAIMAAYGSKQPFVGGSRDKTSGNYKRMVQARAVEYWQSKGLSPEDALAAQMEFTGIAHAAVKLEDVAARMTAAANNAIATAPVVKEASKKIPRTDYPALNELILHWDEHIGDKRLPPFFISLETLAMDYASALGMGNSVVTEGRAQHARDLMKKGWSDGQLGAAVDQMLVELNREKGQALRGVHVFVRGAMATAQSDMRDRGQSTAPSAAPSDEDLQGMSDDELNELQERARRGR